MLRWLSVQPTAGLGRALRQLTAAGCWRRALAWKRLREVLQADPHGWTPPPALDRLGRRSGLRLVPLCSAQDILQESECMRHCGAAFLERCRANEYLMLSVRDRDSGERRATLGIQRDGQGRLALDQMVGFANAPVPEQIARLARRALAALARREPGAAPKAAASGLAPQPHGTARPPG